MFTVCVNFYLKQPVLSILTSRIVNMKNTSKLIVAITAFVQCSMLSAQKVNAALNVLLTQHPSEKIYIHYDKDYYVTGETIWFKAYLFSDGKPSSLSNNFYLQLADNKGKVVISQKYPVLGAVVKGNINLPDSILQGNYSIRAITPRMLNYDDGFIYTKNVFIYKQGAPASAVVASAPNLSLQFFPESGYLADGILTVAGFKAVDEKGIPAEVEGIIKTEDGNTIASFRSYHDGIGKVQFKPQAGKKYVAEVETAAGKRTYPLPDIQSAGINLKVQHEKGGKKFLLSRTAKDKELYDNLRLVAQINNHIVFESEVAFENYLSIEGHLVTDSLPSGILQFTVFNKDGIPLAERLTFIDNGEYRSNAGIETVKLGIEKRAANILELVFPEGIQRSCSVAVIDLPGKSFSSADNIISRFLLTGDLKGFIYNPAWYFSKQDDTTRLAMDNLMLTHGWTRFNWTKILASQYPDIKYKDRGLISISGRVVDPKTREILPWGKLGFIAEGEDSSSQTLEAPVDANGRFTLDSIAFFGKTKFFYGYTDKNTKQRAALVVMDENKLDNTVEEVPADISARAAIQYPAMADNKEEMAIRYQQVKNGLNDVKVLENVTVKAVSDKKPVDMVNEKYTSGVFKGEAKEVLDNTTTPITDKSLNVIDYIKNRIQQVEFTAGRFVSRKNFSLNSGQKWAVGIFLNEQPADVTQLLSIRAIDVAMVKYFDAGFVGVGSTFPGGAISVYTKEKEVEAERPDKLEFVTYKGYTIRKEFFNPDYSVASTRQPASDKRTTLYWNPDIFTDTEIKSIKLNFYNNDISRAFKVVLEGFDAAGKFIHVEKIIKAN
jgi:hypothetical protein